MLKVIILESLFLLIFKNRTNKIKWTITTAFRIYPFGKEFHQALPSKIIIILRNIFTVKDG